MISKSIQLVHAYWNRFVTDRDLININRAPNKFKVQNLQIHTLIWHGPQCSSFSHKNTQ